MPLLFSYGTLQQRDVQQTIFGRVLHGVRDELAGYEQAWVAVDNPQTAACGRIRNANVIHNGQRDSRVLGTLFEVTDAELAAADYYEATDSYRRTLIALVSGKNAWVYAHARP